MDQFYRGVSAALEESRQSFAGELTTLRQMQEERVQQLTQAVRHNLEDVDRLLAQQATPASSSIFILSQHEVLTLALKTLTHNMHSMSMGRSGATLHICF
jgi:hypothetical protein